MFDSISRRYDLLNHLLSLGQDIRWRKKLTENLSGYSGQYVLDLATGTADVPLHLCKNSHKIQAVIGIDMARQMLRLGRTKVNDKNPKCAVYLFPADALQLPVKTDAFHAVTIAFGIRNLMDVKDAFDEMRRILKPGGRAIILEFSFPDRRFLQRLYLFYFRYILPLIGGIISGESHAYRYLNRTVETFPYGEAFCELMREAGFRDVRAFPLTGGIATLYRGDKS